MSDSVDKKSARKYWWIIMLLPIGLAAGTILSLINHLKQNEKQEEHNQYKVAVALNAKDIETGMQRALLLGERTLDTDIGRANLQSASRFIQGSVSPGGTGQQFDNSHRLKHDGHPINLSFVDIEGVQENDFTVVVIELSHKKSKGDAAILGLTPSVIRSLAEAQPLNTLRFVLTPYTQSTDAHAAQISKELLNRKQSLNKLLVLKTQDSVGISDLFDWVSTSDNSKPVELESSTHLEITHPALLAEPVDSISPAQVIATLKAADQLRNLLLRAANQ
ncbi:hypothetical protein ACFPK9_06900 [Rubritalea spongiae]|uniref:SAF domain-containing protein n=1 Tax=Rubritalea spongiae TaxID=430797 RepID=A0ABW5E264_9BACT